MSQLLSEDDLARQAYWSQEDLPDIAQRLVLTGAGGAGSTQTWVPTGDPFACRVTPVAVVPNQADHAFTLVQRSYWNVSAADTEVFLDEHRFRLTVNRPSGAVTFDVEILQPRYMSTPMESRALCRGPV